MYWSLTTITTIGYGDISPNTSLELVVSIFVFLVGAVTFGYIIGNVGSFVTKDHEGARIARDKMKRLNEYMRMRNLPKDMRQQIVEHFEYVWRSRTVYNEEEIFEEVPSHLRQSIALYLHAELIDNVPFLREMGKDCVSFLVTKLQPTVVSAGQYVFKQDFYGQEMYIIADGEVEVIINFTGRCNNAHFCQSLLALPLPPNTHSLFVFFPSLLSLPYQTCAACWARERTLASILCCLRRRRSVARAYARARTHTCWCSTKTRTKAFSTRSRRCTRICTTRRSSRSKS
jgi:hypothetical protein